MNQVTTVLSVVKRAEYFDSQVESIRNQSVDSDIFIIWRHYLQYNLFYPAITYQNESKHFNSLYGRFYNSLHIKTPYTFICDDDLLPGSNYLKRCIEFSRSKDDKVVISSFGVNFAEGETQYNPIERIDQKVFLNTPKKVDMGGQGWFMKTELLKHFLYTPPVDVSTGEDLHFSFCLFKNNTPIYVLDKDQNDSSTWQDTTLGERGIDTKAQWRTNKTHYSVRDTLVGYYVEQGWKFNKNKEII